MVPGSAKPSRNKSKKPTIQTSTETAVDQAPHCSPLSWAERLKRVFDIDISVCPLCGGTRRVIADVTDPDTIQTILAHLRQRAPPPPNYELAKDGAKNGARAAKRSLCRYLMVETTAAHLSLSQQKSTLANRSSPGQPVTTNLGSV